MFFERARIERGTRTWQQRLTALLCTTVLVVAMATSAGAAAMEGRSDDESGRVSPTVDALFLRPLGFVSLVTGVVLFVPTGAMTLITRPTDIAKPFKSLIINPALYVWADPLGQH